MTTDIFNNLDEISLDLIVNELRKGSVGIFPTDTVYGIGCDALNTKALNSLYESKQRSFDKPICILVSNMDMLKKFTNSINNIEQKLIENFWPGALTIIFDKSDIIPSALNSGLSTIGVRMPNNKACLDLINKFGSAIATSSANISNRQPANSIEDFIKDFAGKVSFILDGGKIKNKIPSTIVRVENNEIQILREGSISKSDIVKCFGGNINVR